MPSLLFPAVLALAACSPALDWREVPVDETGVVALLPCKPDRGSRSVPLAGVPTELKMTGCEAAGATFVVAHARLAAGASPGEALAQWRVATLAAMQGRELRQEPYVPARALALTQSVRLSAEGRNADGRAVQAQAVWFARAAASGVEVFQAAVYASRVEPSAADAFFAGLRQP